MQSNLKFIKGITPCLLNITTFQCLLCHDAIFTKINLYTSRSYRSEEVKDNLFESDKKFEIKETFSFYQNNDTITYILSF